MIFRMDPPLVPGEDEARRWAEEELSKNIYHGDPESLLTRLLKAIAEFFSRAETESNVPTGSVALAIVIGLAVVVVLALVLYGPLRIVRRVQDSSHEVLEGDERTAAEIRAAAQAHEEAGQWSLAVLERFRAITQSLIERAILQDRPGQTAVEVARDAGPKLPAAAADIARAAELFDRVCYGEIPATQDETVWLRHLDQEVENMRPDLAAVMA
ncbi:MAG TPA: DUF4129 domain-containing protein [Actinomycetales bacterium]|nr:DUF4129 domain-containing protein [Actinomycetales bacterium]